MNRNDMIAGTTDGWNHRVLENNGVMGFFRECQKVQYELENCRRGSYADFGSTGADLVQKFEELSQQAQEVADQLKELVSCQV